MLDESGDMTGKSIILKNKRAVSPGQLFLFCFWWLYAFACMAAIGFGGIVCLMHGEWVLAGCAALLFCFALYTCGSFMLLSPVVFASIPLITQRRYAEAQAKLARGLQLAKAFHLRKDWSYGTAVSNLAVVKLATGQYAEAELIYGELVAGFAGDKRRSRHPLYAIYLNNLAYAHLRQGELEDAERNALLSKAIWSLAKGQERSGLAFPLVNLAEIELQKGNLLAAEELLEEALKYLEGAANPRMVMEASFVGLRLHSRVFKSYLYLRTGRKEAACVLIDSVLKDMESKFVPPSGYSLSMLNLVAEELLKEGDLERGEKVLERAYAQAQMQPTHPDAAALLDTYEALLHKTGRAAEIADLKTWVRPVLLEDSTF